jgi:hypothetical protein
MDWWCVIVQFEQYDCSFDRAAFHCLMDHWMLNRLKTSTFWSKCNSLGFLEEYNVKEWAYNRKITLRLLFLELNSSCGNGFALHSIKYIVSCSFKFDSLESKRESIVWHLARIPVPGYLFYRFTIDNWDDRQPTRPWTGSYFKIKLL